MYTQTTLFGKHVYIEAPEKQTEGYSFTLTGLMTR